MIIKSLNEKIASMQELRKRQSAKANQAEQQKLWQKFEIAVNQAHSIFSILAEVKLSLAFSEDANVYENLKFIFGRLQQMGQQTILEKQALDEVNNKLVATQNVLKKNWEEHYRKITQKTLNTLNVINSINPVQVNQCKASIKSGDTWPLDSREFRALKHGLDTAENLIKDLSLDEDVTAFLEKMNYGSATLNDLNDKVTAWLQSENLCDRVKLSFS